MTFRRTVPYNGEFDRKYKNQSLLIPMEREIMSATVWIKDGKKLKRPTPPPVDNRIYGQIRRG